MHVCEHTARAWSVSIRTEYEPPVGYQDPFELLGWPGRVPGPAGIDHAVEHKAIRQAPQPPRVETAQRELGRVVTGELFEDANLLGGTGRPRGEVEWGVCACA
jgi:hypothetical protein